MSLDDRFGRLERARRPGAEDAPLDEATGERFEQVERPKEEPRESAPAPVLAEERFAPAPAPAREELELAEERDPDTQPFVRCFLCGADSSVYEAACGRCKAPLDSPQQRAYNERLWAKVQDENRQAATALDETQRRQLGEALAREVASQYGGVAEPSWARNGVGWAILARLPPRLAWGAFAFVVATPVLLVALGRERSFPWGLGLLWGLADVLLFMPRALTSRRRWF